MPAISKRFWTLVKSQPWLLKQTTGSIPLRVMLVVPFALQIIGTVGLVGWLSFQNSQQAVKNLVNQLMDKHHHVIADHLQEYMAEPHRINRLNADAIHLGQLNLQDFQGSGHHFWKQSQNFNVTYIGGALPTGEFSGAGRWLPGQGTTIDERSARLKHRNYTYATDNQGNRKKVVYIYGYDPREENWFSAAIQSRKPVWSAVFNWDDTPEILSIDAGYPVYDAQNRLMAVLDTSLLLSDISKFLKNLDLSTAGSVSIIEPDGTMIASSRAEQPFNLVNGKAERLNILNSRDPEIQAIAKYTQQKFGNFQNIKSKQVFSFEYQGQRQFLQIEPWRDEYGLNWLVAITIPESEFMAEIDQNNRNIMILCLLALVVSIGLGLLATEAIVRPVQHLIQKNIAIAVGNFTFPYIPSAVCELDQLSKTSHAMAQRLQESLEKLELRVIDGTQILQKTERRYRSIFENSREGIFQTMPNGNYITVNPALAYMYGYNSPADLIDNLGNVNRGLYVDQNRRKKFIEIIERDGSVMGFISQIKTKTGKRVWISENVHRVCDDQGQLLYYEGTVQDITAQKRTEAILQRQLLAFEVVSEGIAILTNQKFIYVNPAHLELFGYRNTDDMLAKPLNLFYPPEENQHFAQEVFPILESQGHWQGEAIAMRQDGSLFVEELSLTLADNGDWVCICRDISERKKMQDNLEKSRHEAEVANRTKSKFLANMSHELRTPLNAIYGFSQLLHRDTSLSSNSREYAETIHQSSTHLLGLINDILDMSKIEAGLVNIVTHNFDLHKLLDMIAAMFKLKVDSTAVSLAFLCQQTVPRFVVTDENKLRQVLINLVGNAVKFTTMGYIHVNVSATGQTLSTPESPVSLHFSVEDSGPGITKEELDSLFKPFVQTATGRDLQQGTGLGLSISQKFVELMGGKLTVESTVGQGTTFQFWINADVGQSEVTTSRLSARTVIGLVPHQPTYRILIADDQVNNRRLLVQLLSPLGFEVKEVTNGRDAIAQWENWSPHLILMDMRMPEMDGYQATRYIKTQPQGASIPILALTASALLEERSEILAAGCDDCIYKPFHEGELFSKLEEYLSVQFLYHSSLDAADQTALPQDLPLSPHELVTVMSSDWIAALHTAARSGDDDQIHDLISQVPPEQTRFIEQLTELADQFAFEKILKLTSFQS